MRLYICIYVYLPACLNKEHNNHDNENALFRLWPNLLKYLVSDAKLRQGKTDYISFSQDFCDIVNFWKELMKKDI